MTTTITKKRSGLATVLLLIGAGLLGVLLLSLLVPRVAPWSPPTVGDCDTSVIVAEDHAVHFFTLDEGKEVPLAFGTNANKGTIQGDLDEFCRRILVDPSLVAGDMPAFGYIEANSAAVEAEERKMLEDPEYWKSVVDRMLSDIKTASNFKTTAVPAGSPTLYMKPNADQSFVHLYRGYSSHDGTILQFTLKDGTVVKLRLDCGIQPIFDVPPPEFPECTGEGCHPECPPETPYGGFDDELGLWVCKDSPENAVNTGGAENHQVSDTADGATNSIGLQDDPVGDAQKAEDKAKAETEVVEQTHQDAIEDDVVGDDNQENLGESGDTLESDW